MKLTKKKFKLICKAVFEEVKKNWFTIIATLFFTYFLVSIVNVVLNNVDNPELIWKLNFFRIF